MVTVAQHPRATADFEVPDRAALVALSEEVHRTRLQLGNLKGAELGEPIPRKPDRTGRILAALAAVWVLGLVAVLWLACTMGDSDWKVVGTIAAGLIGAAYGSLFMATLATAKKWRAKRRAAATRLASRLESSPHDRSAGAPPLAR